MKVGIDVGGVIIDRACDGTDTSFFGDNFLNTTPVLGVFQAVKDLIDGGADCYVVSKCGKKTQERTELWLVHHEFFRRTGFNPENLHFCRERHEKGPIAKSLKLTHFIDDKLEVLGYVETVSNRYLLNSMPSEVRRYKHHLPKVKQVSTWGEVVKDILKA